MNKYHRKVKIFVYSFGFNSGSFPLYNLLVLNTILTYTQNRFKSTINKEERKKNCLFYMFSFCFCNKVKGYIGHMLFKSPVHSYVLNKGYVMWFHEHILPKICQITFQILKGFRGFLKFTLLAHFLRISRMRFDGEKCSTCESLSNILPAGTGTSRGQGGGWIFLEAWKTILKNLLFYFCLSV